MIKHAILALAATAMITACSPIRAYHGYQADEIQPNEIEAGKDTRTTVLASLGSPSTKSIFDDKTWFYVTTQYASYAFRKPQITEREITAIKFGDDNVVDEIVQYDADDGEILRYAARETATRGRQLGLLEQLFGNAGTIRLPNQQNQNPGQIPGQ